MRIAVKAIFGFAFPSASRSFAQVIVAKTMAEGRQERAKLGKLAFVPTMGALHAGHVSLMTLAKRHASHVAVSIFVNPTQFGPNEDFGRYPRPIEADLQKCEQAGVDLVFLPTPQEMYPPGAPTIQIDLPGLTDVLEGKHRPGHFTGVCQIVAKLFNILQPDLALFGQKDFQQLRVLTAMVESLDFPIQIMPCPTLRDLDGMAMSSRNQYLSADDRQKALSISRGLFQVQSAADHGMHDATKLLAIVRNAVLEQGLFIDYIAAVDPQTLKDVKTIAGPTVLAVAARAGTTRLIDNLVIIPKSAS